MTCLSCQPTCDEINPIIWPTVCSSSVMSILPSANPMVKMPMSTPVRNFPHDQNPGKLHFVCTSMDSPVHHKDSLSVNSSPSAANPSKIPCNYGERNMVNYLHENPLKSPTISTLYIMPFGAPVCASSIQSICTLCITSVVAPVHASPMQPIHTLCITSVLAPNCASPILSILPYDDEHQEFPDGFPGTKYGEKPHPKLWLNSLMT